MVRGTFDVHPCAPEYSPCGTDINKIKIDSEIGILLATISNSDKAQNENCAKFVGVISLVGTDIAQITVNLPPQKGRRMKNHQISLRNEVKA